MAAKYSLLFVRADCSKRHVFEHLVYFGKATIGVSDVFVESLCALLSESEVLIDHLVFVITSEKINLLGILEL